MTASARGIVPLQGRQAEWMSDLLSQPDACQSLIEQHGSPVNVLRFDHVAENAAELIDVAARQGIEARVFVARKANKSIGLIDAVRAAGLGMDVASYNELDQCLDHGMQPERLILSAAVKSAALIRLAVDAAIPISVDNHDELSDIAHAASASRRTARVALRLAVVDPQIPPTRFGLTHHQWRKAVHDAPAAIEIEGVHFHLNGYSASHRSIALRQACELVDVLRAEGHPVQWIDMGGGVPMTYLDDEPAWREFWACLDGETRLDPTSSALTWRGDRLGMTDPLADRPSESVYPYWQSPTRGEWLDLVLGDTDDDGVSVAQELNDRGLGLHLEPGRAMLDGCGLTLAQVALCKTTSDEIALVGLHMNRTQVRSTSADFLVDPVQVRPSQARDPRPISSGFLVGAYCIEEELLLRRRIAFTDGVSRDDLFAFINTAGYLMHILESPSHQLGLAANVVWDGQTWATDPIDHRGP